MTPQTPIVWHLGRRSAALAERLAAGLDAADILGPQSQELPTAFAAGRPIVAVAAASGVADVLTSRRADPRHEARCAVVDEAARIDWPASRMTALGTRPHGEAASGVAPHLAGSRQ